MPKKVSLCVCIYVACSLCACVQYAAHMYVYVACSSYVCIQYVYVACSLCACAVRMCVYVCSVKPVCMCIVCITWRRASWGGLWLQWAPLLAFHGQTCFALRSVPLLCAASPAVGPKHAQARLSQQARPLLLPLHGACCPPCFLSLLP